MNFNHVLAAIGSASRFNTLLLALLVTCVVVAACIALYLTIPLALEFLRAQLAKRRRRKARVRARRAAVRTGSSNAESAASIAPPGSAWSRKAVGAVVTCSVVMALGAITALYVFPQKHPTVARAIDADWIKSSSRLRIDYELRSY